MENIEKDLYKIEKYNALGDIIEISYFMDIDENTGEFLNFCKLETISLTRNANTGIPYLKETTVEKIKGEEIIESNTKTENISIAKGIELNQNSRKNLVGLASDYLVKSLIAEYGENDGIGKAKAFLDTVINEREKYILSFITELLTAIENTTLSYITTARKNKLVEILNVVY